MKLKVPVFKQLIIGLPNTGKTTFLAALWNAVYSEDPTKFFKLKDLPYARDYMVKISTEWATCKQLERTSIGSEKNVQMKLEDTESGKVIEVCFPDLSGETFLYQLKDSQCTKHYDSFASKANGILLFIHPNEVVEPVRIDEVASCRDVVGESDLGVDEMVAWKTEHLPTQVQLIELLQFYLHCRPLPTASRIAVIVSAWDILLEAEEVPEKWVEKRLPLLDQFLKANQERLLYRVYGLSAQGGDIEEDMDHLLEYQEPSERIIIDGEDCCQHDITAPLKWLIGNEV